VLMAALAVLATSALGASALLLTGNITLNVQEPVSVNSITDTYPLRRRPLGRTQTS